MTRLEVSREIVGRRLDPIEFEWRERDAILYALGVGARPPADLDFLYEARGPRVLPTFALIASWYGMNFEGMPELRQKYGYEIALGVVLFFTLLTWVYLKKRKWF